MNNNLNRRFKIIPALDLMNGVVVQGLRGERSQYQPIKSVLTSSTEFWDVLDALKKHFGFTEFYIADLDAITSLGQKNQLNLLAPPAKKEGYTFWVDVGICDLASAAKVFRENVHKAIVGTETLLSLEVLQEMILAFGSERIMVSIDTKDGKVISRSTAIAGLTPSEAIKEIRKMGIQEFILLELARVGTGSGLDKHLIQESLAVLTEECPFDGTLFLGGGVSGYEDLKWLAEQGVGGVLIASVLHNGIFDSKMIKRLAKEE